MNNDVSSAELYNFSQMPNSFFTGGAYDNSNRSMYASETGKGRLFN